MVASYILSACNEIQVVFVDILIGMTTLNLTTQRLKDAMQCHPCDVDRHYQHNFIQYVLYIVICSNIVVVGVVVVFH